MTQGPPPPGEDPQPNQEFPEADLGFLLRCFNEIGYNTQTVGSDQLSYVLMRNKLIGGVLFLQLRRKAIACSSAYESFAYDCISEVRPQWFRCTVAVLLHYTIAFVFIWPLLFNTALVHATIAVHECSISIYFCLFAGA